jgi:hypothetical protein
MAITIQVRNHRAALDTNYILLLTSNGVERSAVNKVALRVFVWVKVAHLLFKTRAACRSALSSEGILHLEVHMLGAG